LKKKVKKRGKTGEGKALDGLLLRKTIMKEDRGKKKKTEGGGGRCGGTKKKKRTRHVEGKRGEGWRARKKKRGLTSKGGE